MANPDRILIVDDDPEMCELLLHCLTPLGYGATSVGSGQRALELIKTEQPSVVILDLMLPGISGMEVFKRIRERWPEIEIIVLTAYASVENTIEALRQGAYDYVTKPFNVDAIQSTVTRAIEKQRLETRLAATYDLSREMALSLDVNQIAETVLDIAGRVLEFEIGGLWLVNEERDELYQPVICGTEQETMSRLPLGGDERITGTVVCSGEPLYVPDVQKDPKYTAIRTANRSKLAVPLKVKECVIGVLNVESAEVDAFSPDDARLLSTLAAQAAVAIGNAQLYEQAQQEIAERKRAEEALRYQVQFEELVTTISTNFINLTQSEMDDGINRALQAIGEFIGVDRSYISLFSDDGTKASVTHEWCTAGVEPQIDKLDEMPVEGFAWCMERINQLEIIHIPRVADLPPEASAEKEILQTQDIQSLIIVPMVYGGSPLRYLGFDAVRAEKTWAEDTIVLIKIVGEIFANALERKRAEEELGRRNEELAALNKTGQAIPSTLDLDQVLTLVMAEARSMLNAGTTSVLLHEPASEELYFAAVAGAGSEMLIGTHLPANVGIAGLVMQTGQPMLIPDAQSDTRFYDHIDTMTGLTTHSLLTVPLLSKGEVIGVIEAVNRTGRAFDQHALGLLSTLAGSAAIAIENARLYEETAHRLAETRALQEVTLAAASTLDFDQALTRAIQAIHRTLGIEYLSFLLPDESEEYLSPHPSLIGFALPSEERLHIPLDRSVSGRVYTTGQPELIDDVTQTSNCFRCTPGLRSKLAVPVRVGEHIVAVLNAESTQPAAFSEDDLRTLQAIAAQMGIVMENARLYEAEREQRKLVEQSQLQLVQSEKLAATGRLAASLAHEINNPLQAIHNSLQLMLTFALNVEEQEEYLQMAAEEVERLISMVTHILEFARRPQREMRLTRLNEVIKKVLALTSKYLQHRHIILRQNLLPNVPAILATPDELGQVFLNLVLNAVDAMPKGGTLSISSHLAENEHLAVAFSDTGNGIPPEYLDRIFEPFFSTREEGTGLGLTISYNVVERHGGEITVQSVMGEGTTFTVWLPVLPKQDGKRNM